jgi:EAL domain-containing protein (putative c-di-GMP-specific phosphodiesterase class I)
MGCQFGQGYLLSRPVDAQRATGVLAGNPGSGLAVA